MHRGIYSLFLAAAASAALVAGCGSSSTPTSSSTSSSTSSTPAAVHNSSTSSHAAKTTSTPTGLGALGAAAISGYCESALAASKTHLSASQRSQFQSVCAQLAHDNPTQIKAAAKTLCQQITKVVPAAEQALAAAECAKL
jgi:hypothetical protein